MYIHREVETTLDALKQQFKVVLVTGSRQVGKSTTMKEKFCDSYKYVSLDDRRLQIEAHDDPHLFFKDHKPPVIVDEVQKAPDLFSEIKLIVDNSNKKGTILLTGSQTYKLMQKSSETLAGRIAVLEMSPLSLREIYDLPRHTPFIPDALEDLPKCPDDINVWYHIWRGMMPELTDVSIDWDYYYTNYVNMYIERDVREIINIAKEENFYRFLVACAARTACLLDVSNLAKEAGIDPKTARSWLSILTSSGIIRLIRPYHTNASKRVIKSPKLYFMDTGLACHLLGWSNELAVRNGALSGALFETFVVAEILKSYLNDGRSTDNIFFYRDQQKREIDLLIRRGSTIHPIEIKKAASPTKDAIKNFSVLDNIGDIEIGCGAVICQTDTTYSLSDTVRAIPLSGI